MYILPLEYIFSHFHKCTCDY